MSEIEYVKDWPAEHDQAIRERDEARARLKALEKAAEAHHGRLQR